MANPVPDRGNAPKRKTPAQQFDEGQHDLWDKQKGIGLFSANMALMMGNKKQSQSAKRYLKKKGYK